MSDSVFDGQIFAEKLSKLNSSQQSIESLSRLCISHRKKTKQIVETWDKAFSSAQREQRVSFLYLANDILQNSRRKGSEFVNEFWKVLPAALKNVYENGDENGKKAASRLVDIWEERKVFGSRGQNLKDEMLGKHPPPSISNGKTSNPVKIVKRDSHSLRIKLAVGGMPEKILTAFQSAHEENVSEENALNKCKAAASLVGKMEKDVEITSAQGFASESLAPAHDIGIISDLPATVAAVKNPTSKIVYDESNHERYPPGDPSKRAFAYFVLTGGRFVYASLIRLLVLKFVLSMSASKDVLALASLEVDISTIEPGSTVTVKWRGKPVFIRRRTEEDIKLANSVDVASLRDPQDDSSRVKNPEWLVVVGVCTHLGCIPLPNAGDFGGWFCPCHGSHYDISGRIRKGPAPYNLEVPTYSFMEENKLMIG